ncbi:winged helix-turn-helix domain-containing protein [Afifella pfennigii]|uniref:winged helix-turn-helix domain-containing protein n=1 Tax=Afifella pfennigii TaxID=209897 RepID=UPI00047E1B0D|nr:helix-turn-helix domain-containing protein [Afifella pfennigii]
MDADLRLKMLAAENDELRERIALLKQALAEDAWHPPAEWGLTAAETQVMQALLSRKIATRGAILASLYHAHGRDEPEPNIIRVYLCKMRRKLDPYGVRIKTIRGVGYALPIAQKRVIRAGAVDIGSAV